MSSVLQFYITPTFISKLVQLTRWALNLRSIWAPFFLVGFIIFP